VCAPTNALINTLFFRYGWFYGGHGQVMLCEVIEILFIICWVGLNMFLLFGLLKITGKLRVSGAYSAPDSALHHAEKSDA
jgi:ammonia channel protein AmtB